MTQHASLFDVFNAGVRAASPFLQVETEKLKEKNELDFRNNISDYGTEWKLIAENTAFDGDYQKKLDDFTAKRFVSMKGANTSPYYQKLMHNAEERAAKANEFTAMQKEIEWKKETRIVDYEKRTDLYIESINGDSSPDEIKAAKENMDAAYKLLKSGGGENDPAIDYGPEQEHKITQGQYRRLYEKALYSALGKINATGLLEGRREDLDRLFAEIMPPAEMPDGGRGEWTYGKKKEYGEAAVREHTNRIHQQNQDKILAADAQYRELMERDREAGGGTTYALKANEVADEYRRGVQAALLRGDYDGVTEYADGFKDVIPGLFDGPGAGRGSRSRGGRKSITDYQNEMKAIREELQQIGSSRQAWPEGNVTYERTFKLLQDHFKRLIGEAAAELNISKASAERLLSHSAGLRLYMGEIEKAAKAVNPNFDTYVIKKIPDIIMQIDANKKLSGAQRDDLQLKIHQELINMVADLGVDHLTEEQWVEKTRSMVTRAAGTEIAMMDMNNQDAVKDMDLKKHVKMIEQAHENPDMIGFLGNEYHYIGNKENFTEWQKFTERDIAKVLDIDRGFAETAGWADEGVRKDDVIAIPKVRVTGAGDKDGIYKQDVVTETDGRGRETKRVATFKLIDPEKDEWEEVSRLSGGESVADRDRQARQEQEDIAIKRQVSSLVDGILSNAPRGSREKSRREKYDEFLLNLNATYPDDAMRNKRLLQEELRKRGIDPETMEPLEDDDEPFLKDEDITAINDKAAAALIEQTVSEDRRR